MAFIHRLIAAAFSGGGGSSLPNNLYVPNEADAFVTSDGLYFVTA